MRLHLTWHKSQQDTIKLIVFLLQLKKFVESCFRVTPSTLKGTVVIMVCSVSLVSYPVTYKCKAEFSSSNSESLLGTYRHILWKTEILIMKESGGRIKNEVCKKRSKKSEITR